MQEIDIKSGNDNQLSSFSGYLPLVENNYQKSGVGSCIKNGINFTRRSELEGLNDGLIVVNVGLKVEYRIIM